MFTIDYFRHTFSISASLRFIGIDYFSPFLPLIFFAAYIDAICYALIADDIAIAITLPYAADVFESLPLCHIAADIFSALPRAAMLPALFFLR